MENRYDKVFGIGLNKTGTKSLMSAFKLLGFKHKAYSPKLINLFFQGRYDEVLRQTECYETFDDWPWPLMVPFLLAHFEDRARFILTKRVSSSVWVESLKSHSDITCPRNNPRLGIYGHTFPHGKEKEHECYYHRHLIEIRELFKKNNKEHLLIELCWEESDGWIELCGHLDKPVPKVEFPYINAARNRKTFHPNIAINKRIRERNALVTTI